jgi:hypothetical protein
MLRSRIHAPRLRSRSGGTRSSSLRVPERVMSIAEMVIAAEHVLGPWRQFII